MAEYLLDTNVLLRLSDAGSPSMEIARRATNGLMERGELVYVTSQNIIEFWAVATRPIEVNGLGWTVDQADRESKLILDRFLLLEETPGIFEKWLRVVHTKKIMGKQAHDARFVAIMLAHGISHLVTFNTSDFARFSEIHVVSPAEIILNFGNP